MTQETRKQSRFSISSFTDRGKPLETSRTEQRRGPAGLFRSIVLNSWLMIFLAAPSLGAATGEEGLPLVSDIELGRLQSHCEQLIGTLEVRKSGLPEPTLDALRKLLHTKPAESERAVEGIQKLLDPYCLVGITINPESRVKVVRGPAGSELTLKQTKILLAKVYNDGGVTHPLAVTGPEIRARGESSSGKWLEASATTVPAVHKSLTGRKLEYVLLELRAYEAGKREATLRFDVGQGTQDLGFRAEVAILFAVRRD
jgi:hypothetical protein